MNRQATWPSEPAPLNVAQIESMLHVERIGRMIEHIESTESTNDEVWRRVNDDGVDGLTIFAEHQTAGRGRFGRRWLTPPGTAILGSTLILDHTKKLVGPKVVLASAVAVHDAIEHIAGIDCVIKWPNDILVGSRKLGGILVESRTTASGIAALVLGFGINCYQSKDELPDDVRSYATSIAIESVLPFTREQLAAQLLNELDHWLSHPEAMTDTELHDVWLERAEPVGTLVELLHRGKRYRGSIVDLDPGALLVVRLDEGCMRAFNAAETTITRRELIDEDQLDH